jgi:AcrR family transcriptional regulator
MPPTRREQQFAAISEDIKATARQLMAEHGTAGVSLRQIARAMEMSAPSLYHYYASYDALITALIVDAFNALADTLEQAANDTTTAAPAKRVLVIAHAYRTWALQHPIDFQLIYGNPIPGYHAPREATVPAVVRSFAVLTKSFEQAIAETAELPADNVSSIPHAIAAHLETMREQYEHQVSRQALYYAVVTWSRMHGIIMLELFHHIQPAIGDVDTFFRSEMEQTLRAIGLNLS